MGLMKDFDIRIRNGGDDAVGAVNELMAELQRRLLELQASMPRWTPVTERLPDNSEPVLLWCPPEDDDDDWLTYCDIGRYSHTNKGSHCFDTDDGGAFPTHWMTLPAPPTDAK